MKLIVTFLFTIVIAMVFSYPMMRGIQEDYRPHNDHYKGIRQKMKFGPFYNERMVLHNIDDPILFAQFLFPFWPSSIYSQIYDSTPFTPPLKICVSNQTDF